MVSVNLVANTSLQTAEDFKQLVVKEEKGNVVRLYEIADVVLGAESYDEDVRFNGQTATFMGIWCLPTANSLDVIKRVREELKAIQPQLPAGMTSGIPYDSTLYIQKAISEVLKTLTETLIIVIIVIFLFLGSFRSVLIPIVAIPISLIGAVFLMLCAGFTINLLTLLAIVLSVGLVVDDAIVMVENVERHLHMGEKPFEAAIHAARELRGPIIAMTITLAAVYAPIGFQGGLTGALFREFAFTLAGAVIVSGVVALTLSPMMGSRLLRSGDTEKGFAGFVNRRFDGVRNRYTRALTGTLNYRPVVYVLWAIVTALIFPFYLFSQKELAPIEDQSIVFGVIQAAPNSTLDQTKLFTTQVEQVFESVPEHQSTFQITSPGGGFSGIVTKPWDERKKNTQQIQMAVAGGVSQIPGIRVIPLVPPALPGGGSFPVDFVITSTAEPRQLAEFAQQLVGKAFASGMFIYADSDLKFDQPQAEVVFDRDKLRSQGVDLAQAGKDLSTLLGGNYVNRFSVQGRSYKVIPQVKRAERLTPDQLEQIYVRGSNDKLVPLSTFATLKTTTEPRELKRFQQLNAVHIQGVIPQGVSLVTALNFLEGEARKILPQGYIIDYAGESRQVRTEGGKFLTTVPAVGHPDLSRAGRAVRELPRSLHHPRGVGAAGAGRVADVLVPGVHDAEHLQPGRLDHARRPDRQERHPDRRVRQPGPGAGQGQGPCGHRGGRNAAAPGPHDDGRHGDGPSAPGLRAGPRRGSPQQHRHHARERHDHRDGLHPLRRSFDLRPGREDPQGGAPGDGAARRGPRFGGRGLKPGARSAVSPRRTGGNVRLRNRVAFVASLALTVCLAPRLGAAEPPAEASSEFAGMDAAIPPGDNFYGYANGGWLKDTEIPADRASYGVFTFIEEEVNKRTVGLIQEAGKSRAAPGSAAGMVGAYYDAYMDEAAIEAKGLTPIQAELDGIQAITDRKSLARVLGSQLRADVDALNNTNFSTDRLFGLWVAPDFANPEKNVAYLMQGGLGMPDRDDYRNTDPKAVELQGKYRDHIVAVLKLAHVRDADARGERIYGLERKIADAHVSREDSVDVLKANNPWPLKEFSTRAPGLDWAGYFEAAGLSSQPMIMVWHPAGVTGIAALVASQPLELWKDYLTFRAVDRASGLLPRAFAEERFKFYGTALSGATQQRDRWKRGVSATSAALGDAVGKLYVERYFPPEAKAKAQEMVKNIVAAFGRRIDALDWMTPGTRARAKAKVASLYVGIGYPEHWRDYSGLKIERGDALGNAVRSQLFDYRWSLAKLGKPVDKTAWSMTPQTVNAVNLPLQNALNFPAAFLNPPFFDMAGDPVRNYGGIGTVIGHEICHSFDDQGSQFDASGRLANWWTPEDFAHFRASADQLARQYDAYEPLPGLHINGKLTLSENIADLAGVSASFDGYRSAYGNKSAPKLDGFSGDQRFFFAYGQAWRGKMRPELLRSILMTDGHAPGEYRVDTVRNIDAWYDAFGVAPGRKLYLAPEARVRVW